jgi:hypothetical protein
MKKKPSALWSSVSAHFAAAPFPLRVFIVFCVFVTVFGYLVQPFLSDDIKGYILPITGWSMAIPYSFNLIVIGAFLLNPKAHNRKLSFQYGNVLLLALFIAFGLFDWATWSGGYEGNPYLFKSPWRLVWTIAVPIIWIVVLLSPSTKKYLSLFQRVEPEMK